MNQAESEYSFWPYIVARIDSINVTIGARMLSVTWDKQAEKPVLHVMVNPTLPKLNRQVRVVSTAFHLVGEHWEFVGTATAPRKMVWHVFVESETAALERNSGPT